MPSIFTTALHLAAFLVLPVYGAPLATIQPRGLTVEEYNHLDSFVQFRLPCPGCFGPNPSADESLVFPFEVRPTDVLSTSDIRVNYHQSLPVVWEASSTLSFETGGVHAISLEDSLGNVHSIALTWAGVVSDSALGLGAPGHETQTVHFRVTSVDDTTVLPVGFTVIMRPTGDFGSPSLIRLIPDSTQERIDFHVDDDFWSVFDDSNSTEMGEIREDNGIDLANELETLGLLEAQAVELQVQITAKKAGISDKLRQNREQLCLKHLLEQCDGIVCKAQAVLQRICDKMGIKTNPGFGYNKLGDHRLSVMDNEHSDEFAFRQRTKHTSRPGDLPMILSSDASAHPLHSPTSFNPSSPVIRVLEVIAAVLGLTTLFYFIKRKCASARTKAERAADLEQKRNERAYRRAARRALMRKRWDNLLNSMTCFKKREDPRIGDYEEKRALILQDALLEQDLDQAEKGQVMEAEIRELRYAHEIISSLVRVDENRYDLATPVNDPPPPLVPLPRTPTAGSSRASIYTLPSYTSEILPDYSSRRPSTHRRLSGSTVGCASSTCDNDGRATPGPSKSENSGSSVIDMSPRPSAETLRTRQSGETSVR